MLVVPGVEHIVVKAPETSITATLSGTDLYVEPARRTARPGATIGARAFDLQLVGHVIGCEREYLEENEDFGPEDDLSSDTVDSCGTEDELEEPTLAAGTPSDEDDDDEAAADGANEEKVMENLAADIGKAVHISMLKSIRNTAVLSSYSKKRTIMNMSRFSLLNTEGADDGQDEDLRELLNFQI